MIKTRPVAWLKAARKDFEQFPQGAQVEMARALTVVAEGGFPDIAKPLKGFGSDIYELALKFRTDAYRVVYACRSETISGFCTLFRKSRKAALRPRRQKSTS